MTMTFYNSFRMHFGECLSFLSVKSTQCMVSCFGFYSTWSFIVKNIYVCDELYYPVPGFSGDQFILFLMFSLFHEAQSQINSGLFYCDDYFYNNLLSWCYSLLIVHQVNLLTRFYIEHLLCFLGFFIPGFPKLLRFQEHHDNVLKKFVPKIRRHLVTIEHILLCPYTVLKRLVQGFWV